jgi:hypothetical protein
MQLLAPLCELIHNKGDFFGGTSCHIFHTDAVSSQMSILDGHSSNSRVCALSCASLTTEITPVGSIACVVHSQHCSHKISPAKSSTGVNFLIWVVHPKVCSQAVLTSEVLAAHLTFKNLVPCVALPVLLHFTLRPETLELMAVILTIKIHVITWT